MNNKFFLSACAALILSAVLIFMAAVFPGFNGTAAQTSGSIQEADAPTSYTVKSFGDKIGIFTGSSDKPIKTISIDPASLPRDAQILLEKGITVKNHEELLLLIEDYIG